MFYEAIPFSPGNGLQLFTEAEFDLEAPAVNADLIFQLKYFPCFLADPENFPGAGRTMTQ